MFKRNQISLNITQMCIHARWIYFTCKQLIMHI